MAFGLFQMCRKAFPGSSKEAALAIFWECFEVDLRAVQAFQFFSLEFPEILVCMFPPELQLTFDLSA